MTIPISPAVEDRQLSGPADRRAYGPSGSPGQQERKIGILAGGGRLPLMIAESVIARGGAVHIVGIEGEADAAIAGFPHTWVNWGQIGRMVALLRSEGAGGMVIAGGVRRPDLWKLRPDAGFFLSLPQILAMLRGGDDSVLSRVVRFFEAKGLKVLGAHEVAPDLLVHVGQLGAAALSGQGRADAELGFAVRAALGPLDAGQAVVAADGKVLAIEGAEGTDAMLRRVAEMRPRGGNNVGRSGVLAKGPKPGQELRVDMPAIGPRTVELAAAASLAGVAVEAGAVLLLDRGETTRAADALGLAIEGLPKAPISDAAPAVTSLTKKPAVDVEHGVGPSVPSPVAPEARSQNAGEGQGEGDCSGGGQTPRHHGQAEAATADARGLTPSGVTPTPNPSPSCRRHASGMGGGESERRLGGGESGRGGGGGWPTKRPISFHPLRVLGRLRPSRRDGIDIDKGLAALERLAAFDTGRAVVVARAYILAIAAGETTLAMLARTRALRQWGIGTRRRVGVLVCRVGTQQDGEAAPTALFDQAGAQGLAGVAVAGAPAALARFADAAGAADRLGIFLVACGERP